MGAICCKAEDPNEFLNKKTAEMNSMGIYTP